MPTLTPLFLEQDVWLKMYGAPDGRIRYTRKPEHGVTFINIEVEIEADTLDRWEIAEIRVEMGNSTHERPVFERMPPVMFSALRKFLLDNFPDELQSHVDANLLPASLADHADRVYAERHS